MPFRIAIVGAGISGLALANGLLKHDHNHDLDIKIFDKSPAQVKQGYLVSLRDIGRSAIEYCLPDDVYHQVEAMVEANQGYRRMWMVRHTDCRPIREATPQNPTTPVHRPKLRQLFLDSLARYNEDIIQPSKTLESYSICPSSGRVILAYTDGSGYTADMLLDTSGSQSIIAKILGLTNQVPIEKLIILGGGEISSTKSHEETPQDRSDTTKQNGECRNNGRPVIKQSENHEKPNNDIAFEQQIPAMEYLKTTFKPLRPSRITHNRNPSTEQNGEPPHEDRLGTKLDEFRVQRDSDTTFPQSPPTIEYMKTTFKPLRPSRATPKTTDPDIQPPARILPPPPTPPSTTPPTTNPLPTGSIFTMDATYTTAFLMHTNHPSSPTHNPSTPQTTSFTFSLPLPLIPPHLQYWTTTTPSPPPPQPPSSYLTFLRSHLLTHNWDLPTISPLLASCTDINRTLIICRAASSTPLPPHWRHDLRTRYPLDARKGNPRVWCLGDAIHRMPQSTGAGANSALADAQVASRALLRLVRRLRGLGFDGGDGEGEAEGEREREIGWACVGFEAEALPRAFEFVRGGG
ncbi:hypothetical protein MMC28_009910 [Mycoblastus sanguinarius]|nr:hypothetical protein [Mycoblastus sanguinarius]